MIAALHAVRAKGPAKLVCAVRWAPRTACARSRPMPTRWSASRPARLLRGRQFYGSFPQVDDDEVRAILGRVGAKARDDGES